jgi:hypothetical protein
MESLVVAMLAALALLAAKPVSAAEAIDVSKLSCKQFTEYNNDNRGLIMMWFEVTTPRRTSPRRSTSARWRVWRRS